MSAWIRTRDTKSGERRYQVLYRRGGRGYKVEHGKTFRTKREAQQLRDLIGGWLAVKADPRDELAKREQADELRRPLGVVSTDWLASRIDLSERSQRVYRAYLDSIEASPLGGREAASVTPQDVRGQIGTWLESGLSPKSVRERVSVLRQVLDFADVTPNPARHRSVKLPAASEPEVEPPSSRELLLILERVAAKYRPVLLTIEQTAMRVGETVALEWRDVDVAGARFRVRAETRKGRHGSRQARWVQVPRWLMDSLAETCPVEDRTPERRVFHVTEDGVRSAMRDGCKLAGIVNYSPHDLRHRRISLWHGQGVPAADLAKRAGHSKPSMSLDVYSHVMPLEEAETATFERLLVVPR